MLKIHSEKSKFARLFSALRVNSEQQELPGGKRTNKTNCITIKKVQSSNDIFFSRLTLLKNFPCSLGQSVSDGLCGNPSSAPAPASALLCLHRIRPEAQERRSAPGLASSSRL